jgi:hypothetical protein
LPCRRWPPICQPDTSQAGDTGVSMDLDVIAKRLDVARQQIQPSLGASVYDFSTQELE